MVKLFRYQDVIGPARVVVDKPQLFGPEGAGGMRALAYTQVRVKPGQNLAAFARASGTTPHGVAAATGLGHFFVSPHQELKIPGPGLDADPEFQAAAQYYDVEYQKFENRMGSDPSLARGVPDLPGTRLTSSANYAMSVETDGVRFYSTHIDLDPRKTQLRLAIANAFNAHSQEQSRLAKPSVVPVVRESKVDGVPGLGMRIGSQGIELVPAYISPNSHEAQVQRELAQQETERVHAPGRRDELTLTENRWASAFGNTSSALYGALSLGADAFTAGSTHRWAEGKRVHHEHQAALADVRAQAQGAVTHTDQIESTVDFLNWLAGHGQQMAVPLVTTMLPGGVLGRVVLGTGTGARVTGVLASTPHSVGSVAAAQRNHSGQVNVASTFFLGALHAGMNAFGLEGALMSAQPFRNTWLALDSWGGAARALGTGLRVAPKEAGTEGTQVLLEHAGITTVDPGQTVVNPHSIDKTQQALYAGGAFGFVGGAGYGGWRHSGLEAPKVGAEHVGSDSVTAYASVDVVDWVRSQIDKLWPVGGFNLWPRGAGAHPAALFSLMTPEPLKLMVPKGDGINIKGSDPAKRPLQPLKIKYRDLVDVGEASGNGPSKYVVADGHPGGLVEFGIEVDRRGRNVLVIPNVTRALLPKHSTADFVALAIEGRYGKDMPELHAIEIIHITNEPTLLGHFLRGEALEDTPLGGFASRLAPLLGYRLENLRLLSGGDPQMKANLVKIEQKQPHQFFYRVDSQDE